METIRNSVVLLITCGVVASLVSCRSNEQVRSTQPLAATPSPSVGPSVTWTSYDLDQRLEGNEDLKRAWTSFVRSQKYRLAQPSDRRISPAAMERVKTNGANENIPFLTWWGASGYDGRTDILIAIVVDPSRSDAKRYGLVVIAAPKSEGVKYKPYWVLQEEDMENYLFSPASGSVFMECFHPDGTHEIKKIVWERKSRQFRLI